MVPNGAQNADATMANYSDTLRAIFATDKCHFMRGSEVGCNSVATDATALVTVFVICCG